MCFFFSVLKMTFNPRCGMHIAHAFLELDFFFSFLISFILKKKSIKRTKNTLFPPHCDFTLLFEELVWLISVLVDFTAAYTQRWKSECSGFARLIQRFD